MNPPPLEPLLSVSDLAHLLGLRPQTIYNRLSSSSSEALPPVIRLGSRPRWAPAEVRVWLEAQRVPALVVLASPIPNALRRQGRSTKLEQLARLKEGGNRAGSAFATARLAGFEIRIGSARAKLPA